MNTSLSWIKAYVPELEVTAQEFTDAMTLSGSKVEGFTKMDADLEKIVIGQIKKIEKHPDADKLIICQVDIGEEAPIQIVTGAPNVKEGDKVPVVLDGGRVAGGHDGKMTPGGIRIKKGKLRGIESNGMMCSIEELGSTRDMYPEAPEYGIYIFPETAEVGADAIEVLGLHDVEFEFEITSNRVDCYSTLGLARETAATFHKEFKAPEVHVKGCGGDVNDYIKVEVQDHDLIYHTVGQDYRTKGTMRDAEESLADGMKEERFFRCNRCYLVNLDFVENFQGSDITVNGDCIQVSRARKKAFLNALNDFMNGVGK